jgi:hypothetical protein
MLATQPLMTKSLTSSCIMSVSDALCQKVVSNADSESEGPSKLDSTRILHVAITGSLWSGPITHYWYIVLEKWELFWFDSIFDQTVLHVDNSFGHQLPLTSLSILLLWSCSEFTSTTLFNLLLIAYSFFSLCSYKECMHSLQV